MSAVVAGPDGELGPSELEAGLEARRELGPRYDAELVEGFAERIERAVDRRVSEELERRRRSDAALRAVGPRQLALGIISLVAFIPISIVLGVTGNPLALVVALAAIVAVNLAHARLGHG